MTDWGRWIARKLGTDQWVVSQRLTAQLRVKGYRIAISQRRYRELQREYEEERGK